MLLLIANVECRSLRESHRGFKVCKTRQDSQKNGNVPLGPMNSTVSLRRPFNVVRSLELFSTTKSLSISVVNQSPSEPSLVPIMTIQQENSTANTIYSGRLTREGINLQVVKT